MGYLNLFRTTDTLSGGESQRLKMSKHIGSNLKNKIIFLDEPLTGLSSTDVEKILNVLKKLVLKKATIIFIEHNVTGFKVCNYMIELGPERGDKGGKVIFKGDIETFLKSKSYERYKKYVQ